MLRCCKCRCHQKLHSRSSKKIVMDLEEVGVKSLVRDGLGRVDVSQKFCNRVKGNIECEYVFPVPEDAVLTEMFVTFESGETIHAQIQETETAKEIYSDAISSGSTSIMSSYKKSNEIIFYMGNFLSETSLTISISYTIPLSTRDSYWYLEYPLLLYAITTSSSKKTSFCVKFLLIIESTYPIQATQSNFNAECVWSDNSHKAHMSYNGLFNIKTQQELFISYNVQAAIISSCLVQEHSGNFAAMVSFIPFTGLENIESKQGTGEFVLLFDRSGSMSGQKISLAKQACIVFIKSLPAGSKFNIVSFGDDFHKMFDSSAEVNEENIEIAVEKVGNFEANMGGTNIKTPLGFVFKNKADFRYPRSIFLLTDGEVYNTSEIIDMISENSLDSRVHSIGIGSGADKDLIIFSAKAGRGSASFVEKVDEIGKTVVSALKKAILPCLNNWQVSLSGEQAPENADLGNVFYGDKLITYFFLREKPNTLPVIQAYNNLTGQIERLSVPVITFIDGDNIFPLWAKMKIDKLCSKPEPDIKEIVKISKEHKALSPYTSFICVKENEEPNFEEPLVVKMQNQTQKLCKSRSRARCKASNVTIGQSQPSMARGRGGLRGRGGSRGGISFLNKKSYHCMPLSNQRRSRSCSEEDDEDYDYEIGEIEDLEDIKDRERERDRDRDEDKTRNRCRDRERDRDRDRDRERYGNTETKSSDNAKRKKMSQSDNFSLVTSNLYLAILSCQSLDGRWDYKKLQKIIPAMIQYQGQFGDIPNSPDCFSTLFAICYLESFFPQHLDELELILRKAKKWLELNWTNFHEVKTQLFALLKSSV